MCSQTTETSRSKSRAAHNLNTLPKWSSAAPHCQNVSIFYPCQGAGAWPESQCSNFLGIDVQPYFIKLPVLHFSAAQHPSLNKLPVPTLPESPWEIKVPRCPFLPPCAVPQPQSSWLWFNLVSDTVDTNAEVSQPSAWHCPLQWEPHKYSVPAQCAAASCDLHKLFPSLFCLMSEFLQKFCTKQWRLFNFETSTKAARDLFFGSLQHLWLQGAASALMLEGICTLFTGLAPSSLKID